MQPSAKPRWWNSQAESLHQTQCGSLQQVNLDAADLSGARLTGIVSYGISGTPILPTGWSLFNGTLVGPGANLQSSNLASLNFAGMNLSGATLQNADLRRSNLQQANLQGAQLQGANLQGASFSGANLNGANLDMAQSLTSGGIYDTSTTCPNSIKFGYAGANCP